MNDKADRSELLALLQTALELELATIPSYLVALLSIRLPRNREAAERIRGVMMEEMLHMALVANVMNAVGGSPRLNEASNPSYPLTMTFRGKMFADRRFPIDLAPFSEATISTFTEVEKPMAALPRMGWLKSEIDVPAPTIGTFYARIVEMLEAFEAEAPGTLFIGNPSRQLENDYYWSGGGRLISVTDLDSAKAALALVIDQGEGAWSQQSAFIGPNVDAPFPMGHYFRFSEVFYQRRYARGDDPLSAPTGSPIAVDYSAVFPIKTNARSSEYAPGSEAFKLNDTFNRLYTSMLRQIEEAFNGSPKTLYTAIMNGMHGVASAARALVRVPIEGDPDGKTACPTFEWIDVAATADARIGVRSTTVDQEGSDMSDYGDPDIYRSPRYTPEVTKALSECTTSAMWDDWDLAGLLTDVPHAFAAKMGAKFGIFCSTGTAGLHASLMALELLPGDEIIAPCMTFIRAVTPLVHLGLQPVLVDVDRQTGNIHPEAIAAAVSPRTRAVVVIHMWGIPADMAGIRDVCQRHGLQVIEDFSHAHFSMHELGPVGSFGSVGYGSLQRKKTFSVGEGGIIVTSDPGIYDRLRQITSPGSFKGTPNYNEFSGFGLNMRMSPFSSVVARCLLERADEIVAARAKHADEFSSLLSETGLIHPPAVPAYVRLVSAYGYKPSLSDEVTLDQLAAGNADGLWRFSRFSYDAIAESPFWRKPRAHYPFALQIQPKVLGPFPGYKAYLEGRVSLAVPTVGRDYWTDDVRNRWRSDLMRRLPTGT